MNSRASRRLASLAFACMVALGAAPAVAQQTLNIRAVVNDEAISAYDLEQRLNLIIRTSGLNDSETVRRDLSPRIVNTLVDEALQMQEAKRLGVTVDKKEIDAALALLERQNGIAPGSLTPFLKERDIDPRTLSRQIEATLAWGNIVRRQFLRSASVTEEDVNKSMERIKANADKPRILVAEIFIAVDSPRDEAAARQNAQRIYEELRRGAVFPQLARQFSQSASAEKGGDLGWIPAGELEPELDKALLTLPKNAISEPIRTSTGFYIVTVRDRREPARASAGDTMVSLRQILLPLPAGSPPAAVASQQELAQTIGASVRGCEDFSRVTRELGTGISGDLGQLKLGELPADLRAIVGTLEVGTPSTPVIGAEGIRVLIVCERKSAQDATLPKREEVEQRLIIQRLELRARRHLRDLRDTAFLDIRA